MEALKSVGSTLLGVAVLVAFVVVVALLFIFGANIAFAISPFVNWLAGILFVTNMFILLAAIIPKARAVAGIVIYLSSYVYGLATWIYGLAVTLTLWGWLAVIIGLLLGGVGIVPIGMLAAIFNGHWDIFWTLLLTLALTYGSRIIGALLVDNAERRNEEEYLIDLEPPKSKRTWGDIE